MSRPPILRAQVDRELVVECERWRDRRDSYRPAGERIDPSAYSVDLVDERTAKRFVTAHHYSGSYPAARARVGLFCGRALVGVAVFSVPVNVATVARYSTAADGVELGRLVLLDEVPANGETWFLARAFRALRIEKPSVGAVVSYSDPVPRLTAEGALVKPGHLGIIYQAFNALYVGRSRRETVAIDRAGRVVNRRALSKIRNDETGAGYAYEQLLAAGAPTRRPLEDGPTYVSRALRDGPFRRFRHPGNHTYVWTLRRDVAARLPALAFPKPTPAAIPRANVGAVEAERSVA